MSAIVAALLMTSSLISGCVSGDAGSAIDSAGLSSSDQNISDTGSSSLAVAVLTDAQIEAQMNTMTTGSASMPIPMRSPGTSSLALAQIDTTPNISPAENAIDANLASTEATQSQIVVASASTISTPPTSEEVTTQTASSDNAQAISSAQPVATPPVAAEQVTTQQVAALSPPVTRKRAVSSAAIDPRDGVFQRKKPASSNGIFAIKPISNDNSNVNTTSAARSNANRSGTSALPGVKRKSELFGIKTNESEADDDDQDVQVASIGALGRAISPQGLILQTESVQVSCFKPELLKLLTMVERKYGKKVMVTSGYRNPSRNRRAGGVSNSTHIYCKAADIQVAGVDKWALAKFLRTLPGRGGVGTYCRTESVHIDSGTQRDWHHACRRGSSRVKKKA